VPVAGGGVRHRGFSGECGDAANVRPGVEGEG
jgi:hypothetical protein